MRAGRMFCSAAASKLRDFKGKNFLLEGELEGGHLLLVAWGEQIARPLAKFATSRAGQQVALLLGSPVALKASRGLVRAGRKNRQQEASNKWPLRLTRRADLFAGCWAQDATGWPELG